MEHLHQLMLNVLEYTWTGKPKFGSTGRLRPACREEGLQDEVRREDYGDGAATTGGIIGELAMTALSGGDHHTCGHCISTVHDCISTL